MKKLFVVGIVVLFFGISIIQATGTMILKKSNIRTFYNSNPFYDNNRGSGLVTYWNFDEGTGNILHDVTGKGYDGTIYGATWTVGVNETALEFDGDFDYVDFGDVNEVEGLTQMTVSVWINATGEIQAERIITKEDSWYLSVTDVINENEVHFVIHGSNGASNSTAANYPISLDSWYHVVAIYDKGNIFLYIDGILKDSATNVAMPTSGCPLSIGARKIDGKYWGDFFDGIIDEARIYNKVLSEEQIQYLYENPGVGDIIYVDDDYNSLTLGWQIDHFDKIQDGIDTVNVNGTVYVYNGTYYENIDINKDKINLSGKDRNTTIIDGSGIDNTVKIWNRDYINLTEFTIRNAGGSGGYGVDQRTNSGDSKYNVISNCIIYNNRVGLKLQSDQPINTYSENNTVINCEIYNNTLYGAYILCSYQQGFIEHNKIVNSKIHDNSQGIVIDIEGTGTNNSITNCKIYDNSQNGIYLNYVTESNINNCSIYDNYDGVYMDYSNNNNIIHNDIKNHLNGMWLAHSDYNLIENNSAYQNSDGIYLRYSDNNKIIKNNCSNNQLRGIHLRLNSDFNNISQNTISHNCEISGNFYGIHIRESSDNIIYHNNFIDNNGRHAWDGEENQWDDGYPSGGNYWDDYIGTDVDGDGIGDIPYNISGDGNQDIYPLMHPWGKNPPVANYTYYIDGGGMVTFIASSSYDRDGEIISYYWDFGDGTHGMYMIERHIYSESGVYNVTLTVTDNDGYVGNITKIIEILNLPPDAPIINGPKSGRTGRIYSYIFLTTDPDGDDVFYQILWGDGTSEKWIGPFPSDELVTVKHSWSEQGKYTIMARAKDVHDEIGDWETLEVTMPRYRAVNFIFKLLNWFFEQFPLLERLLKLI